MEQYRVPTITKEQIKNRTLTVCVPGSKSMTNRALLLTTLAEGKSVLKGVLFSDDSRHFMNCVKELGIRTDIDEENRQITVFGMGGKLPVNSAEIYVGSAGTAARFLTALLGLMPGVWKLNSSEQMKKRPMAPLLNGLKSLGTKIDFEEKENYFPFTLHTTDVESDEITINIDESSQFLSAMLISACCLDRDFTIHVEGSHGMAYIDMTTQMMEEFGVVAKKTITKDGLSYRISKGQSYQAKEYQIEPDVSAACYFYAMAMLLSIDVLVPHVTKDTFQGDLQLLNVFEAMGGTITETKDGLILSGPSDGILHGVNVDMHSFSDQAITLAAVAVFADSPTTITGIGHIRFQESNRIAAIVTELNRLGIKAEELPDGVRIYPGVPSGGTVTTYDDHRMAMGFSLIGLRAKGIVIDDPDCCRKTFEDYFRVFDTAVKVLKDEISYEGTVK